MAPLGPTRTDNAINHAKRHAANPKANSIWQAKTHALHPAAVLVSNAKQVYIAGKYEGTDLTTGIPGGRYKTWDEARAAVRAAPTLTRRCAKCHLHLPLSQFRYHQEGKGGRQNYCDECGRAFNTLNNPRVNAVSASAYKMAGGSPAFYRLPQNERLALRNQARTFMAQKQVGGFLADRYLPASEIVARSARRAASGDDEIQHSELDRIRAETIRRYAAADRAHDAARDGFVYVMYHTVYSPGIVKVGHSRDPYKRASQANTTSAEGKHRIIYMRFFKDRMLAESLVHSLLWHHRVQGEHFRVSVGEAIRVIAGLDE